VYKQLPAEETKQEGAADGTEAEDSASAKLLAGC